MAKTRSTAVSPPAAGGGAARRVDGPDCHVVIRAAGERTEAACARLAALEVGADRVSVIHEVPFSEAVRRGFEIGAAEGRVWTLCLDADVLLAPGAVAALCSAAEAERGDGEDLFELDARVADKLLGQIRSAGVHLYRTAFLDEALRHVSFDPSKRRPETRVKTQMRARGYRTGHVELVAGLHDHEQYHRDIFRKVFTHARKHERFMSYASRYWRRMARADADLRMAHLSWCLARAINEHTDFSAIPENENVSIDIRAFPDRVDPILLPAGMREKAPLPADGVSPEAVAAALAAFVVAPEFRRARMLIAAARRGTALRRRMRGLRDRLALRGQAPAMVGRSGSGEGK